MSRTMAPRADEHLRWLRANAKEPNDYFRQAVGVLPGLGALTGTDHTVLAAIDRCWDVYAHTRSQAVLSAVTLLLPEMQPRTRCFARALIARSMDWGDIAQLWPLVATDELTRADEKREAANSRIVNALEAAAAERSPRP